MGDSSLGSRLLPWGRFQNKGGTVSQMGEAQSLTGLPVQGHGSRSVALWALGAGSPQAEEGTGRVSDPGPCSPVG